MPTPLRGGLIGCGYVSQFHLEGWKAQKHGQLVAVCDLDHQRANLAASDVGADAFTSPETMFESQKLDFVEICTRPVSHESLVQLAAKYRVPILCQKPVAADMATINRMRRVLIQNETRLMVHENWRFRPWYRTMHQAIENGSVGQPVRLRINAHDFRCLAPEGLSDQPYFAEMPKLVLYEMGPHLVEVARSLFGDPATVFCTLSKTGPQVGEDTAHLVLQFPDEKTAILDICWATQASPIDRPHWGLCESVLETREGTLSVHADGHLRWIGPDGQASTIESELQNDPRQQSYSDTQAHFLQCLLENVPFETSLEDNRYTMAVVFAGYQSAERGQVVSFDEFLAEHEAEM